MNSLKTICFTVTVLCLAKCVLAQHYESEHPISSYNEYSVDHDVDDGDSGYVAPLDFSPIYGSDAYGSASNYESDAFPKASNKKVIYLSQDGSDASEAFKGKDYFLGQSSDNYDFFSNDKPQNEESKSSPFKEEITSKHQKRYAQQYQPKVYTPKYSKYVANNPEQSSSYRTSFSKVYPSKSYKTSNYQPYTETHTHTGSSPYQGHDSSDYSDSSPYGTVSGVETKIYRFKRYSDSRRKPANKERKVREEKEEDNPYDYSRDYRTRQKEFDEYDSPDYHYHADKSAPLKKYDYGVDEEYSSDGGEYDRIKSLSEKQAAEAKKNPENCKEVKKDSMTCTVCTDPKNGGNYESCSYVSEPKNNKYSYATEQKFDKNGQPEGQKPNPKSEKLQVKPESTEQTKPTTNYAEEAKSAPLRGPPSTSTAGPNAERIEKYQPIVKPERSEYRHSIAKPERNERYQPSPSNRHFQTQQHEPVYDYYTPNHNPRIDVASEPAKFAAYQQGESNNEGKNGRRDYNGEAKNGRRDYNEEAKNGRRDYNYEAEAPGFYAETNEKKNVEHVLAEFARKDRSDCKKVLKNEMTCFQCTDKSGLKNEECMFVSESAPKSSHLAYKEVKEFNTKPEKKSIHPAGSLGAESQIVSTADEAPKDLLTATSTEAPSDDKLEKPSKKALLKKYFGQDDAADKSDLVTKTGRQFSDEKYSSQYVQAPTSASKTGGPVKRNIKYNGRKVRILKEINTSDADTAASSQKDDFANPSEFAADSRGAFWAETVPIYTKKFGMSLPGYMLSKSEEEIMLDEFFASDKK